MGISADLMKIITKQESLKHNEEELSFYDDLDEEKNLYEILPKIFHSFIFKNKVTIYDLGRLSEVTGIPESELEIDSISYNGNDWPRVTFKNFCIREKDIPMKHVEVNSIVAKTLHYLGSAGAFVDSIYEFYHNKKDLPYILTEEDFIRLYDFENGCCTHSQYNEYKAKYLNSLFVDLNY